MFGSWSRALTNGWNGGAATSATIIGTGATNYDDHKNAKSDDDNGNEAKKNDE